MKRALPAKPPLSTHLPLPIVAALTSGITLLALIAGAYLAIRPETGLANATHIMPVAHHGFVFRPYAEPRPVPHMTFENGQGRKLTLADFKGKVVLLNIWATWCPSCRKEMPTLDRLQKQLGGAGFEVVALSIDQGGALVVKRFFDEVGVRSLAVYADQTAQVGGDLGLVGLPTTLLIDRGGLEIGRVIGPAEWDSAEVIGRIRSYLAPQRKP